MSRFEKALMGAWSIILLLALVAGCTPATTSQPSPIATSPGVGVAPTVEQAQPTSVKPITLGFAYGSFSPQSQWEKYFSGFLAAHPNVTIKYYPIPLDKGWGDYTEKIITLIVGGEKIDVIWDAIEAVPLMAEKGVLAPLDSYMTDSAIQEYINDVHPKLLQGLTWKGSQYLLPFAWNNVLMFYNENVFKQNGLAEPAQNWSWNDFLTDAQKITTNVTGSGSNQVWGYFSTYNTWSAGPWTISNGTFWMNEDFSMPLYDQPKTIESLQFAYDLVSKYEVSTSDSTFNAEAAFAAGTLGMMPGAPATRESLIPAGVNTTDYNINFWPSNTGDVIKGSIWGTDGYGITNISENKDMAWELIKALMSKDVMSNLVTGTNASGSAPARRSLATSQEFAAASPANYLLWYQSLDAGRTVINSPIFATLNEIHDRYLSQAWVGEMTITDAAANIQEDMESAISENP